LQHHDNHKERPLKNLILTTAALALTAGIAFAGDTVTIATEGAYEPWNYVNDDGELAGFEIELGNELCLRASLDCIFIKNDWDSIIPNLVSSNYDAIMAGMSITAERDKVIDFTSSYSQPDPSMHLALSKNVDLSNGIIAAQSNTIQSGYLASSGATLVEFSTPEETIAAVRNGEADAVLADKSFLGPIADEDSTLMFVGDEIYLGGGVGVGLRESDSDLKALLSKHIDAMKADGSLNALIIKHKIGATF
jgi:polar amino acid transport system substrate-binding protein